MDLMEVIKRRYSCRFYRDKPVEAEKLNQILEAARLAPSARNFQEWRFIVVTDRSTRAGLSAAAYNQSFVAEAPVVIVACSGIQHLMRCGQQAESIDVAIAIEHIVLAATSLGLGSCWVGSFYPDKVRQILHIPSHIPVIELLTIGYPADAPKEPERLPLERIFCVEKWTFR